MIKIAGYYMCSRRLCNPRRIIWSALRPFAGSSLIGLPCSLYFSDLGKSHVTGHELGLVLLDGGKSEEVVAEEAMYVNDYDRLSRLVSIGMRGRSVLWKHGTSRKRKHPAAGLESFDFLAAVEECIDIDKRAAAALSEAPPPDDEEHCVLSAVNELDQNGSDEELSNDEDEVDDVRETDAPSGDTSGAAAQPEGTDDRHDEAILCVDAEPEHPGAVYTVAADHPHLLGLDGAKLERAKAKVLMTHENKRLLSYSKCHSWSARRVVEQALDNIKARGLIFWGSSIVGMAYTRRRSALDSFLWYDWEGCTRESGRDRGDETKKNIRDVHTCMHAYIP